MYLYMCGWVCLCVCDMHQGCRVAIQNQIATVEDEGKLVEMLKLNDELSDKLDAYEQV